MHHVEPKVYLIGKSSMHVGDTEEWLKDLGVSDEAIERIAESGNTDAERLVEAAGRRCYKSFDVGLNPNVTQIRKEIGDYIENILKVGHGSVIEHVSFTFAIENVSRVFCYHKDTEILTRSGWKQVWALSDNEILLTKNPTTGKARWSNNKKLHAFEYVGPLHYWTNVEEHSPMITPDHTIWAANMWLRKTRGMSAEQAADTYAKKIPYQEMIGKIFTVDHRIGDIEGAVDPVSIEIGAYRYEAGAFMEWLGLVATDGCINKPETGRHRVRVNQSKPEVVTRIRELTQVLFGDRCRETGDKYKAFDVSDTALYEWVIEHIGRTNDERKLTPLLSFSTRLLGRFMDGVILGDGSINTTDHAIIHCSSESAASELQTIAASIGRASRVIDRGLSAPHELPSGQVIVATKPGVALTLNKKGVSQCQPYMQRAIHMAGMVFCPQTDDGVVFVRHPKGRAMWCGNTGEMNRHRAGVAISEGSMRFIRYTDIPYWVPTSIQTTPEEIESACADESERPLTEKKSKSQDVFDRAFTAAEGFYSELLEIWRDEMSPESKFKAKKEITSMMRRIIPMGVATGGIWTLNLRALRHVCEMRCSPVAEEEILLVITKVLKIMQEEEPNFFGDFTTDAKGFSAAKYKKV